MRLLDKPCFVPLSHAPGLSTANVLGNCCLNVSQRKVLDTYTQPKGTFPLFQLDSGYHHVDTWGGIMGGQVSLLGPPCPLRYWAVHASTWHRR